MDVTIGSLTFDPVAVIDATQARLDAGWLQCRLIGSVEVANAANGALQDVVGYCFIGATASALGTSDERLRACAHADGSDLEEDVMQAISFVTGKGLIDMFSLNDGIDFMHLSDEEVINKKARAGVLSVLSARRAYFVKLAAKAKVAAQYDRLICTLTEAAEPQLARDPVEA